MKLVVQQPKPPQALRLLLQADDDADGIDVALSAAGVWAEKKLTLVINGLGKDLSAFASAGRHHFAVLCDDAGRPTRSLTEIAEAFESLDREQIGAVVVLDTNRIYRATRCSVRDIDQLKNLSPGHWDDTNEALGLVGELLTRAGMPSIFVAPPSEIRGVNEDGEDVLVGTKPQAWKDLARQAHALLKLSRRGRVLDVEIAGDDWRKLGQVGEVVQITGVELGKRFADLAQGRAGEAAGTTLAEATAAELAARTRRAERRRAESERARDSLSSLAWLRAYQGPDAWARHMESVALALGAMSEDDAAAMQQKHAAVYGQMSKSLEWMAMAERTAEMSPYPLHRSGIQIAGPAISECPARDDMPVADLPAEKVAELATGCEREEIAAWIASLAQYAGVWTESAFAVVCVSGGVGAKGPSWEAYTDEDLRKIVQGLLWLVSIRRQFDPQKPVAERLVLVEPDVTEDEPLFAGEVWEPVEAAADAGDFDVPQPSVEAESDALEKLEAFIGLAAAGKGMTVSRPSPGAANGVTVELPDPAAFAAWSEKRQIDTLGYVLAETGAFDDWDRFRNGTSIGSSKAVRRWSPDERAEIYRTALAKLRSSAHREAA